jgi:hypothetical protein
MRFPHWSLNGGFPLCSTTINIFTHWDSWSGLDSISLVGGFLPFVEVFLIGNFLPFVEVFLIGFYSKGLFHALLASGACEG